MICTAGKTSSLTWCFLASIALHSILLWRVGLIWNRQWPSFAMPPLSVTTWSSGKDGISGGKGTHNSKREASRRGKTPAASNASPAATRDSSAAGGGEGSPGLENVLGDPGGLGVGGVGSPSGGGPGGTGSGGAGNASGSIGGKPGPSAGNAGRSVAPVITVPPSIQRSTSPYESEVYVEVDSYALFTADFRLALNVPGNQVCLDGNILRTYEREVMTRTVTDISKCRFEDYADKDEMRCPKEAHATMVTYNNYLSSPVTYSVNLCLLYDQSNCHWIYPDDGPEREICRPVDYRGIWAQGTKFHYQCAKSTSQTYSHPLQYEVRFVQDVEFPEQRTRKRILLREKRSVPSCP